MAENKKSFILYADQIEHFEELTNEEAGKLIKHIFRYVNDEKPIAEDRLTQIAFNPIKQQLKRDLVNYLGKKEERSKSGILGNLKKYNTDLYDNVISDKITLIEAQNIAKTRTATLSEKNLAKLAVNDNVNDNVNVITNKQIISIDDAEILCLANSDWLSEFERINKVPTNKIPIALTEFKSHCISIGKEEPRTLTEFKQHFGSWVRIKKQYKAKEETNKNIGKL